MPGSFDSGVLYSRGARLDLANIAEYTLREWGEKQAGRYLNAIQDCCGRLVQYPLLGRACDHIEYGLRKMEQGQHVIFYCLRSEGILVVRILHRSIMPEQHPMQQL